MTLGMQLRYWFRKASHGERLVTVTALGIVAVLLVASVALAPAGDGDAASEVAAVDAGGGQGATAGGVAGSPGAGGEPGAAADGGATGSAGQPGGAATGGGGSSGGAGAPAGTAAPGTDPAAADPAAGGGAAASGDPAAVELTASDRGVTPTEIRIGFLLQNPAGLNGAGFSTGQRTDGEEYVQALADWAGTSGRVPGRKVVPVLRYTDPTSVEDQAAACRALVDDAKVFGVADVASILDTAALDCFVNPEKGNTPFVHSAMWSRDWQKRSGGNEVSYQAAIDRISVTWARDLGAMRWFPEGATVGILGDKCPATEPTIVNVLGPALKANGAKEVVFGNHDCDIESVVSQPPNIATQFRLARVTHVLLVSNFVASQIFISSSASQGYQPEYSASDWFLNTNDPTAANFDPAQFDGAVGIGSLGSMLKPSGKAPYPGWEQCSQIAVDAGLPPIGPDEADSAELLNLCDNFLLLIDAIAGAGPNPTRAGWRDAVTRLGDRTSAVFGPSRFAPDKTTGSDFVHTLKWRRDCRCWRSVSDFRPAAA